MHSTVHTPLSAKQRRHCVLQARLETPSYLTRLGAVWLGFFVLVAGPIAFQTFDPSKQVLAKLLLSKQNSRDHMVLWLLEHSATFCSKQ